MAITDNGSGGTKGNATQQSFALYTGLDAHIIQEEFSTEFTFS